MEGYMKKTLWMVCALVVAMGLLQAPDAQAQGDQRAGTAGAEYLLVPVTARTAALGQTTTGGMMNMSAIEGLQVNPAAMMTNTGTEALFSRMNYVADIGINYFGVAQRVGDNNIALSVSFWDFGSISKQTEIAPDISDVTYSANNVAIGASFARQFTDRIAAGVTLKALSERIDDVSASGVALDAGMTYTVGESGLRFGVSLRNFGPQMSFSGDGMAVQVGVDPRDTGGVAGSISAASSELPSMLNFGVTYTRAFAGDMSVTALGNFRSNAYDLDQYSAGLEVGYRDLFYVRGGGIATSDMDVSFYQGWNVGAGFNLPLAGTNLTFDYAYRGTRFFSGVNLFTVGFSL
jgi:hypothetical protein